MASNPPRTAQTALLLPTTVVTPKDIGRLLHELEDIENKLLQLEVRSRSNGSSVTLPDVSEPWAMFLNLIN